ncbi:MAG: YraN family protein [Flavobacteriaceae bacterium]
MAQHNQLGKEGEQKAVAYLEEQGYHILETNWYYQKAEVDIIAIKDSILAAVEVKTRSSVDFGLPHEFVKPQKIKLLTQAIDAYVVRQNLDVSVRFDIISIYKKANEFIIEHLEDAFFHF